MNDNEYLISKGIDLSTFKLNTKVECAFADLIAIKNSEIRDLKKRVRSADKGAERWNKVMEMAFMRKNYDIDSLVKMLVLECMRLRRKNGLIEEEIEPKKKWWKI